MLAADQIEVPLETVEVGSRYALGALYFSFDGSILELSPAFSSHIMTVIEVEA